MTQQFLDLKTLSRLKDLPLVAKTLAHGFLHGVHNSIQRGVGIEFSQYRVYEPGDELSKIDWKLFARSDRYFVREAERESDINVWLIIDNSASMQQKSTFSSINRQSQDQNQQGISKFDYARMLSATLAYLGQKQGDNVGLFGVSTAKQHFLPALGGERHFQKILISLAQMQSGGVFPSVDMLKTQLHQMQKSGLIVVISDFYQFDQDSVNPLINLVCSAANARTEVIAMQLESQDELTFPYSGTLIIEDLETKKELKVSAKQVKTHYLNARQAFNEQLTQKLSKHQVKHWPINIDQPMDESLYNYLNIRQKQGNS